MEVGDLIKRRNNGDLALVLAIYEKARLEIVRLSCGNTQHVWDTEYGINEIGVCVVAAASTVFGSYREEVRYDVIQRWK